jgi:hypothetical protein
LAGLLDSFKRFAIFLTFLVILGISAIYIYDLFIAATINLPLFLIQAFRIIIILGFWLTIILLLRQAKPFMTKRIGNQAATVLQFSMGAIAVARAREVSLVAELEKIPRTVVAVI